MAAPSSQPLPSKENALFRQLVRFYETKQYKKAVKAADQVLKKFPDHGETLAMKGLVLKYQDKKEEAYDLVRKGLKCDVRSHVCWHVYGLLYRADMNYTEALKCFLCALRIDKDNLQILRDTALLQIQMRDIPGFLDTRNKILQAKPANRTHWIGYAVAHHLAGNTDVAVQIINQYESTVPQEEQQAAEAYEHSELLLYKAAVLREGGQPQAALQVLHGQREQLKDPLGIMTEEASIYLELGRLEESAVLYRKLLDRNPDNYDLHMGLQAALGVAAAQAYLQEERSRQAAAAAAHNTPNNSSSSGGATDAASSLQQQQPQQPAGQFWHGSKGRRRLLQQYSEAERAQLQQLYAELQGKYPRSTACKRIPLDYLTGDAFVAAAHQYLHHYLVKGIPSLFSDLKPLYRDAAKAAALGQLFEQLRDSCQANGHLPQPPASSSGAEAASSSSSSSAANSHGGADGSMNGTGAASSSSSIGEDNPLTWVTYYLAQHYHRLGDTPAALAAIDAALQLAPEVVELYFTKSKILRGAGNASSAAACAESARKLDLSDRYINSMAVKAMFKAGRVADGEALAALFTRDGADQHTNLYDMQHMWYELAYAEAQLAAGVLPPALKKYMAVQAHFGDIAEDQFDFHSYCLRKMTLRAYVAMLRLEDHLLDHPFFLRAAWGGVRCYLALHEAPAAAAAAAEADEAALAALSPEERKREKLRRKKEEKRREAERAAAEEADKKAREAAAAAAVAAAGGPQGGDKKKKAGSSKLPDADPNGDKLAATPDPLGEATKLVEKMRSACPHHLLSQLAAFEVYHRKGRLLLALSAAQRGVALGGAGHPEVAKNILRLALTVAQSPPSNEVVKGVLADALPALLAPATTPAQYVQQYLQQYGSSASSSLQQRAAAGEMLVLVDAAAKPKALQLLQEAVLPTGKGAHQQCVEVHSLLLKGSLADAGAAAGWEARCREAFPWSEHFKGARAGELPGLDSAAAAAADGGKQQQQQANGVASAMEKLAVGAK